MTFTKRAVEVFAEVDAGGSPRGANMGEVKTWGTELESAVGEYPPTIADLKAIDTSAVTRAYLTTARREGYFVFTAGDFSAHVAADVSEGVYVKATDTAASAGAWVRQYDGPLILAWFRAVGDNSANNYTAIRSAIDVLQLGSGGTIFAGAGKFAFTPKITISGAVPVHITGLFRGATIFRQTSATEGGFKWENSTLYSNDGLTNCTVEAGTGYECAGLTDTGSTGTGVEVERVNDGWTLRSVNIHNFARPLRVEGTWNSVFDDLRLLFSQDDAILIGGDGAISPGGGNKFTNIKVSNNGFTGTNTSSVAIRIRQSGGDFFTNIDCTSQANGVKIDPASGKQVAYCFFTNVLADTCVNDGWRIDGSAGSIVGCEATSCWGSYSTTGNGFWIDGANVDGFTFTSPKARENGYRGFYIGASCRNISLVNPQVARNSKSASNTYDGIEIAASASKIAIIGGRIGNFASGLAHEQANGIVIGTGATEITIDNPDVSNYGTGKAGIVNNSTSATVIITGVRPIQLGYSKAVESTLNINSRGTVAAGSTVYLGIGASSATEGDVRGLIGRSCVLTQVTIGVTVAPGSAKSFTYTVFKNGVATSMTGAITGAASYTLTLTGAITYGSLDNFSIRLVTDASSGVAAHQAIMYFDR